MASSEPSKNTMACNAAKKRGSTPSSAGISGKTAAPSGTFRSVSSDSLATGHRGNDRQFIAVFNGGGEIVEVTNVFVIQVQVDILPHASAIDDLRLNGRIFLTQVFQNRLDGRTADLHGGLVLGVRPHRRRDLNLDCHGNSKST